jgi:hypothetical protein
MVGREFLVRGLISSASALVNRLAAFAALQKFVGPLCNERLTFSFAMLKSPLEQTTIVNSSN